MASLTKRGKMWHFRYVDADGKRVSRKGCPDRRATEQMAAKAELEAAQIRRGLIDPRERTFAEQDRRPVAEHLAEWHAFLIGQNHTAKHADLTRNRATRLVELAKAKRLADLTPSRVQAAVKAVRDGGASLRSVHHYTRAVKQLSRWLWRDGRIREDLLAHLTTANPDQDRRHERRALDAGDQARLVRAAEAGPVVMRLAGVDRAMLYRIALGTGFRAAEIRSLTPRAFHLDDSPPTVTVAAAYSKHRRDDVQPIRPDLARALRSWLADRPGDAPIFGAMSSHTNLMMKADLEAAGLAYRDADGRVADFHALRHSFVTALARSSAPVKVVQTLARHSTPSLTLGIYSHVGIHDQAGALDALPDLGPTRPTTAEPMAATGTDGPNRPRDFAPHLLHAADGSRREESDGGGVNDHGPPRSLAIDAGRNLLSSEALDGLGRVESDAVGAEGEGFEPPGPLRALRFSRPPQSTTLPPLRRLFGRRGTAPERADWPDWYPL